MFLLWMEVREVEDMGGIRLVGERSSLKVGKKSKEVEVWRKMEWWVVEVKRFSPNRLLFMAKKKKMMMLSAK